MKKRLITRTAISFIYVEFYIRISNILNSRKEIIMHKLKNMRPLFSDSETFYHSRCVYIQ